MERKFLQWHPAFYASTQIEFKDEAETLVFENEHQLGTKPMSIDVMVIKKEGTREVQKNIGRIFRRYNLIEYKSPTDYLSVDDFYKVYGYACFYKADAGTVDQISLKDLTITFVNEHYPRKLAGHLERVRGFRIKWVESGIYYVEGDVMPIQIIVTKQLLPERNLWLRSLTNGLHDSAITNRLIAEYRDNKENNLYRSAMNMIVRANTEKFQEVKEMCEALEELMKDELDERERKGKKLVNDLILRLSETGRTEDIIKSASDPQYQQKLFKEFGL